ncbi:hypothetical protein LVD15_02795 [Fulvivirga maritima]|uniref:nSTAND1 domain-containing NTPase n=1 Tax=Fulvivirga maritima TaxID=2904247 RepID=UPI001F2419F6|nr:hypothetical protein [Fulvivirga maritima]UII27375.1 hypothetical protein LVD15_02795 [Fulvivirga maritima]
MTNLKDEITNPFPGLRAYSVAEKDYYYSYGYRTDDILSRLRSNQFITLVGEAGGGKESLLNCAIIPVLEAGFAGMVGSQWEYVSFRPGTNPLRNLALVLANSKVFLEGGKIEPNFTSHIEDMLREGVQGLLNVFETYSLKEEHNLLVFINDFEDILANEDLYDQKEDILLFINLILRFIRRSNYPVYLVIALSSDYLSSTSRYPGLPEMINDSQYLIPKMDPTQLKKVIAHGFNSARIRFERELIEVVLQEYQKFEANNYQLQYVLKSMVDIWRDEGGEYQEVGLQHYKRAGRISQAIERKAEQLFDKFNPEQKRICSILFKVITRKDKTGNINAVLISTISEIAECSEQQVVDVVNKFGVDQIELIEVIETYDIKERLDSLDSLLEEGFLYVNRNSKITLRNKELILAWPRLNDWVNAEDDNSEIFLRLVSALLLYRQEKRGFYQNPELKIALDWYNQEDPNEAWAQYYSNHFNGAIDYLLDSEQNYQHILHTEKLRHQQKVRKDKQFRWVLIIASILSLILATWAMSEKEKMRSEKVKLAVVQDLDSIRALYIDALQDLDSAHIDEVRYRVWDLRKQDSKTLEDIYTYTEVLIETDSLCKRGIKLEILNIQNTLRSWALNWKGLSPNDGSIDSARYIIDHFCQTLKAHCNDEQWNKLTSVNSKCDGLQKN